MPSSLLVATTTRGKGLSLQISHFCLVFLGANWEGRKFSHSLQPWAVKQTHNAHFLRSSDSKPCKESLVDTTAAHGATCALGCASIGNSRDFWDSVGGLWKESKVMQTWPYCPGGAMPRTAPLHGPGQHQVAWAKTMPDHANICII